MGRHKTQELDLKVSCSVSSQYGVNEVNFEIQDAASNCNLKFTLTKEDFADMLSGLWGRPAKGTLENARLWGKTMEVDHIIFPMPDSNWDNRKQIAAEECEKHLPEGWIADNYYGSQDSFFTKDGQHYAKTVIRRWV